MKNLSLIALLSIFSFSVFAAPVEYRIQKVKTFGPMKHKVIFQSSDLKKIKGSNVLKGKIVLQWGVHVYEVASGLYSCNSQKLCKLTDSQRIATYEKCTVKKSKVECSKRISGEYSSGSNDSDIIVGTGSPDSVDDDMHRDRPSYDQTTEFPARVDGEFEDVQF